MAAIPDTTPDPTLTAVDAAIEIDGNAEPHRTYVGMSSIGRPCSRELWYGFRWCSSKSFDALSLKRFADGHLGEDIQAERLRMVDGIELLTLDHRTGGQFGFIDLGGHFRGHSDGLIKGLLQAPKTQHVWEHKQTAEKEQASLSKAKADHGEKLALSKWDETYFAQAVLYMHYSGMTRHYLTCATSGGRQTISCRTNAQPKEAKRLIAKARAIITADIPPPKISDKPGWYQCNWCDHKDVCHKGAAPDVNCRTCAHATPELDGDGRWTCARYGCDIQTDHQRQGDKCPQHLYIPALLPWAEVVDSNVDSNWIEYQVEGDINFRNGGNGYASNEIKARGKEGLCRKELAALKKPLAEPLPSQPSPSPKSSADPTSPASTADTSSQTKEALQALAVAQWEARD